MPATPTLALRSLGIALCLAGLLGWTIGMEARPTREELTKLEGQTLAWALSALQHHGIEVIYTDALVTPAMRVETAPPGGSARKILRRLLAPHGLTARPVSEGRWVVVREAPTADLPHPSDSETPASPPEVLRDEITVTRHRPVGQDTGTTLTLNGQVLEGLPHPGGDLFRALTLLPGTGTANELSAKFNVHGGREDEVQVVLDGLELFEPYHLRDFGGAAGIVAEEPLEDVSLITGALPAEYGDRMSAVLELTTDGGGDRRRWLSASVTEATVGGAGTVFGGRHRWLASLRRSLVPRATRVVLGEVDPPRYTDLLARFDATVKPGHELRLHSLFALEELEFEQPVTLPIEGTRGAGNQYTSVYLWLRHQHLLRGRFLVQTLASVGRLDRDRDGFEEGLEEEEEPGFELVDRRDVSFLGFAQDWSWQRTAHHGLSWGLDLRRLTSRYNYFNRRDLADPLAAIRYQSPVGETELEERFDGEQFAVYLSEQRRWGHRLTLESGLRFDENELTEDSRLSPRLAAVLDLGKARALRASWGYLYQSQRPYELQVEDGEEQFFPAERTEHAAVGYEHRFDRSGLSLRVDAYRRKVTLPRPRFENLFDPLTIFPELESDRIRIAPDRSLSQGVELLLRNRPGRRVDWWLSYAVSESRDEFKAPERRRIRRSIDQPHTLRFDLNLRPAPAWNLNFAWRFHSGWPTTTVAFETVETEDGTTLLPVLGERNGDRLPDFHRLDARLSWRRPLRAFQRPGELTLFLDIENLYHRHNVRGFAFTFPEDGLTAVRREESWGGFFASVGARWRF